MRRSSNIARCSPPPPRRAELMRITAWVSRSTRRRSTTSQPMSWSRLLPILPALTPSRRSCNWGWRNLRPITSAMPKSEMTAAGAELDAENLFLLAKYGDAQRTFATLADGAKDPAKRLRFTLRQGQCEYFAGDYAKAVEILQPIASNSRVANTEELQPAIFLCGDAFLQQNKYAPAAEMLGRYVAVAKGDQREAQFKLARALLG